MSNALAMAVQMPWHDGTGFMGMHWFWWTVWIGVFVLLVWAMARLLGDRSETHRQMEREEAAEEALRRRFADGEIDEEEYQRRLRILRETHSG